jgi:hypothetical protein
MAFSVTDPDFDRSPLTGLTRDGWLAAGRFLLAGVFRHVKGSDDPVVVPKRPGKTYPQANDPPWRFRSAEFEGLSRTFLIGAPLIASDPEVAAGGHKLRDYYANQVLRATDPSAPQYVGKISELTEKYETPLFQHTAESAALAVGLMMSRDAIWNAYTDAERDQIAELLADYACGRTNAHNSRWFCVILAAFLAAHGYEVDRAVLRDHLLNLAAYYAGDGWYRDYATFDFYSCWAFQFYAPIWCSWYGYEHEPEIAETFERYHNELQATYPRMFARDGASLMWGRSILYRCAASAPLAAAFRLRRTTVDAGWARRIASGNLLQFVTRDDVFVDGVPSLGFYRTFEPLVQSSSCALSPFWLAKVFLALDLPADSPFWTAVENEGDWDELGDGQETFALDAPGLVISRHGKAGTAELRPGKCLARDSDPNYTRLTYNTAFPWEADGPEGATACDYSLKQLATSWPFTTAGGMTYAGYVDGVLYRQKTKLPWMSRIDLAEIVVPGGCLRVDRLSVAFAHELHLGHFALPHLGGRPPTVDQRVLDGHPTIVARGELRAVALVACHGWDGVESMVHRGLNAEADESTVVYAHRRRRQHYSGMELVVTLLLHRTDGEMWAAEELSLVREMDYLPWAPSGQPCGLRVKLADGSEYLVDFGNIMGRLQS